MPAAPEKVNSHAPPEEMQAAVEASVNDAMDALSQTTAPEVRQRVVEEVAADVTPTAPGAPDGDMSRLLATKIAEVYRELGLVVPSQVAMEAELLAYGDTPLSAPIPGQPNQQMDLTPEQVRERVRKAQYWSNEILGHPSAKKAATIDAITTSVPMTYFSPEARVFRVNDVTIEVPEGEVLARDAVDRHGVPVGDVCGCAYVYRLVSEHGAARRWEAAQQKALKNTVIYGEVDDRPAAYANVPLRGRIS